MNTDSVQSFLSHARQCAMAMLKNGAYIESELSNVELPNDLHAKAKQVCSDLIGTKHDVIHEIFDINDLLETSPQDEAAISLRIGRIVDWLSEPIREMHELVQELQAASRNDRRYGLTFVLIAESATNILNAFNATVDSAGAVEDDVKPVA